MPLLVCIVVTTWTSLLCFEIETLRHICAILRMQLMFVTNIMSLVRVLYAMVCAKKCRECRCVQNLALSTVRINNLIKTLTQTDFSLALSKWLLI